MKKLLAIAALLLASTAAQAQYTFEYGGRTIRVDPDRGTVSIPGVYDNSGREIEALAQRSGQRPSAQGRRRSRRRAIRKPTGRSPAPAPRRCASAPPRRAGRHPPNTSCRSLPPPPRSTSTTTTATAATASGNDARAAACGQDAAPAPQAPPPVERPRPRLAPEPRPASPVQAANSPLGVWLTEEKEGKVRIEQCGANLCGYSVDAKSNKNGEQALINMKPGKDSEWSGRILDPNTGSTYDSTVALKGSDSLRVQGCAFGGMFCGGQTWTRVN